MGIDQMYSLCTGVIYLQALPTSFYARPAEVVAPELIGCLLVKRQEGGELLWGMIVETHGPFRGIVFSEGKI